MAGMGDYTEFAEKLDQAMKCWKLIPEDTGLVDGKLISATGERSVSIRHMQDLRYIHRMPHTLVEHRRKT